MSSTTSPIRSYSDGLHRLISSASPQRLYKTLKDMAGVCLAEGGWPPYLIDIEPDLWSDLVKKASLHTPSTSIDFPNVFLSQAAPLRLDKTDLTGVNPDDLTQSDVDDPDYFLAPNDVGRCLVFRFSQKQESSDRIDFEKHCYRRIACDGRDDPVWISHRDAQRFFETLQYTLHYQIDEDVIPTNFVSIDVSDIPEGVWESLKDMAEPSYEATVDLFSDAGFAGSVFIAETDYVGGYVPPDEKPAEHEPIKVAWTPECSGHSPEHPLSLTLNPGGEYDRMFRHFDETHEIEPSLLETSRADYHERLVDRLWNRIRSYVHLADIDPSQLSEDDPVVALVLDLNFWFVSIWNRLEQEANLREELESRLERQFGLGDAVDVHVQFDRPGADWTDLEHQNQAGIVVSLDGSAWWSMDHDPFRLDISRFNPSSGFEPRDTDHSAVMTTEQSNALFDAFRGSCSRLEPSSFPYEGEKGHIVIQGDQQLWWDLMEDFPIFEAIEDNRAVFSYFKMSNSEERRAAVIELDRDAYEAGDPEFFDITLDPDNAFDVPMTGNDADTASMPPHVRQLGRDLHELMRTCLRGEGQDGSIQPFLEMGVSTSELRTLESWIEQEGSAFDGVHQILDDHPDLYSQWVDTEQSESNLIGAPFLRVNIDEGFLERDDPELETPRDHYTFVVDPEGAHDELLLTPSEEFDREDLYTLCSRDIRESISDMDPLHVERVRGSEALWEALCGTLQRFINQNDVVTSDVHLIVNLPMTQEAFETVLDHHEDRSSIQALDVTVEFRSSDFEDGGHADGVWSVGRTEAEQGKTVKVDMGLDPTQAPTQGAYPTQWWDIHCFQVEHEDDPSDPFTFHAPDEGLMSDMMEIDRLHELIATLSEDWDEPDTVDLSNFSSLSAENDLSDTSDNPSIVTMDHDVATSLLADLDDVIQKSLYHPETDPAASRTIYVTETWPVSVLKDAAEEIPDSLDSFNLVNVRDVDDETTPLMRVKDRRMVEDTSNRNQLVTEDHAIVVNPDADLVADTRLNTEDDVDRLQLDDNGWRVQSMDDLYETITSSLEGIREDFRGEGDPSVFVQFDCDREVLTEGLGAGPDKIKEEHELIDEMSFGHHHENASTRRQVLETYDAQIHLQLRRDDPGSWEWHDREQTRRQKNMASERGRPRRREHSWVKSDEYARYSLSVDFDQVELPDRREDLDSDQSLLEREVANQLLVDMLSLMYLRFDGTRWGEQRHAVSLRSLTEDNWNSVCQAAHEELVDAVHACLEHHPHLHSSPIYQEGEWDGPSFIQQEGEWDGPSFIQVNHLKTPRYGNERYKNHPYILTMRPPTLESENDRATVDDFESDYNPFVEGSTAIGTKSEFEAVFGGAEALLGTTLPSTLKPALDEGFELLAGRIGEPVDELGTERDILIDLDLDRAVADRLQDLKGEDLFADALGRTQHAGIEWSPPGDDTPWADYDHVVMVQLQTTSRPFRDDLRVVDWNASVAMSSWYDQQNPKWDPATQQATAVRLQRAIECLDIDEEKVIPKLPVDVDVLTDPDDIPGETVSTPLETFWQTLENHPHLKTYQDPPQGTERMPYALKVDETYDDKYDRSYKIRIDPGDQYDCFDHPRRYSALTLDKLEEQDDLDLPGDRMANLVDDPPDGITPELANRLLLDIGHVITARYDMADPPADPEDTHVIYVKHDEWNWDDIQAKADDRVVQTFDGLVERHPYLDRVVQSGEEACPSRSLVVDHFAGPYGIQLNLMSAPPVHEQQVLPPRASEDMRAFLENVDAPLRYGPGQYHKWAVQEIGDIFSELHDRVSAQLEQMDIPDEEHFEQEDKLLVRLGLDSDAVDVFTDIARDYETHEQYLHGLQSLRKLDQVELAYRDKPSKDLTTFGGCLDVEWDEYLKGFDYQGYAAPSRRDEDPDSPRLNRISFDWTVAPRVDEGKQECNRITLEAIRLIENLDLSETGYVWLEGQRWDFPDVADPIAERFREAVADHPHLKGDDPSDLSEFQVDRDINGFPTTELPCALKLDHTGWGTIRVRAHTGQGDEAGDEPLQYHLRLDDDYLINEGAPNGTSYPLSPSPSAQPESDERVLFDDSGEIREQEIDRAFEDIIYLVHALTDPRQIEDDLPHDPGADRESSPLQINISHNLLRWADLPSLPHKVLDNLIELMGRHPVIQDTLEHGAPLSDTLIRMEASDDDEDPSDYHLSCYPNKHEAFLSRITSRSDFEAMTTSLNGRTLERAQHGFVNACDRLGAAIRQQHQRLMSGLEESPDDLEVAYRIGFEQGLVEHLREEFDTDPLESAISWLESQDPDYDWDLRLIDDGDLETYDVVYQIDPRVSGTRYPDDSLISWAGRHTSGSAVSAHMDSTKRANKAAERIVDTVTSLNPDEFQNTWAIDCAPDDNIDWDQWWEYMERPYQLLLNRLVERYDSLAGLPHKETGEVPSAVKLSQSPARFRLHIDVDHTTTFSLQHDMPTLSDLNVDDIELPETRSDLPPASEMDPADPDPQWVNQMLLDVVAVIDTHFSKPGEDGDGPPDQYIWVYTNSLQEHWDAVREVADDRVLEVLEATLDDHPHFIDHIMAENTIRGDIKAFDIDQIGSSYRFDLISDFDLHTTSIEEDGVETWLQNRKGEISDWALDHLVTNYVNHLKAFLTEYCTSLDDDRSHLLIWDSISPETLDAIESKILEHRDDFRGFEHLISETAPDHVQFVIGDDLTWEDYDGWDRCIVVHGPEEERHFYSCPHADQGSVSFDPVLESCIQRHELGSITSSQGATRVALELLQTLNDLPTHDLPHARPIDIRLDQRSDIESAIYDPLKSILDEAIEQHPNVEGIRSMSPGTDSENDADPVITVTYDPELDSSEWPLSYDINLDPLMEAEGTEDAHSTSDAEWTREDVRAQEIMSAEDVSLPDNRANLADALDPNESTLCANQLLWDLSYLATVKYDFRGGVPDHHDGATEAINFYKYINRSELVSLFEKADERMVEHLKSMMEEHPFFGSPIDDVYDPDVGLEESEVFHISRPSDYNVLLEPDEQQSPFRIDLRAGSIPIKLDDVDYGPIQTEEDLRNLIETPHGELHPRGVQDLFDAHLDAYESVYQEIESYEEFILDEGGDEIEILVEMDVDPELTDLIESFDDKLLDDGFYDPMDISSIGEMSCDIEVANRSETTWEDWTEYDAVVTSELSARRHVVRSSYNKDTSSLFCWSTELQKVPGLFSHHAPSSAKVANYLLEHLTNTLDEVQIDREPHEPEYKIAIPQVSNEGWEKVRHEAHPALVEKLDRQLSEIDGLSDQVYTGPDATPNQVPLVTIELEGEASIVTREPIEFPGLYDPVSWGDEDTTEDNSLDTEDDLSHKESARSTGFDPGTGTVEHDPSFHEVTTMGDIEKSQLETLADAYGVDTSVVQTLFYRLGGTDNPEQAWKDLNTLHDEGVLDQLLQNSEPSSPSGNDAIAAGIKEGLASGAVQKAGDYLLRLARKLFPEDSEVAEYILGSEWGREGTKILTAIAVIKVVERYPERIPHPRRTEQLAQKVIEHGTSTLIQSQLDELLDEIRGFAQIASEFNEMSASDDGISGGELPEPDPDGSVFTSKDQRETVDEPSV